MAIQSTTVADGIVKDLGASDRSGYRGFAVRATTTGIINIREGGASGKVLDTIALTAPAADRVLYEPAIACVGDLYCEVVSGVWVGSIKHD